LFVFVGSGSMEEELRMYAKRNGIANVRFEGMREHGTALEYIRSADVLVVPSKFEGFGLTALEGMALGTPVVAKPAGALKEMLAKESLAEDIAARIRDVLENQDFRDIMVRKNADIAKRFGIERMIDGIEKVYDEVREH
ncbi:MAG: glycosyltransferase family 4 protein, partial [Candidatus Aenigmatarchaeota archaeon]